MKLRVCFVLALLLIGCGERDDVPTSRTSFGLRMDGTRRIPFSTIPSLVEELALPDSTDTWATAPVPLTNSYGYAIATRRGLVYVFGAIDSLKGVYDVSAADPIVELLANDSLIFYVTLGANTGAMTLEGKTVWKASARTSGDTVSRHTANAAIMGESLLIPSEHRLTALSISTGKELWRIDHALVAQSLAVRDNAAILLLTGNIAGGTDSVYHITSDGKVDTRAGFPNTRFISNICWFDKDKCSAGYLSTTSTSTFPRVGFFAFGEGKVNRYWSGEVPYFPVNIAADDISVFSSGFRFSEGETESGIDAFRIKDTVRVWQRRFTEPLAAPVAVGPDALFFPISFSDQAEVPTRAILFSLNSEDGKTLSQRPIRTAARTVESGTITRARGAQNGVMNLLAMPDDRGRMLLLDPTRLTIWILSD